MSRDAAPRADRPGAALGLLMLETRFMRPAGDIGHPDSFRFPTIQAVVPGASVSRIVRDRPDASLIEPFIAAARSLIDAGAIGIGTSCGFLAPWQRELAGALRVPVAVSSLLQVPWVQACLPAGQRVGVITADAGALGPTQLCASGAAPDTPVVGLPRAGAFWSAVIEEREMLDPSAIADELVQAGHELRRVAPSVGAVVLECTNLPPYRTALARAIGLPVFDVLTLLDWFWQGLSADHLRRFPARSGPPPLETAS